MKRVLVVAPHADDETLGCGGTLHRHIDEGCQVSWLIVTSPSVALGYAEDMVERRRAEIETVADMYGFHGVHKLDMPVSRLDAVAQAELIEKIGSVFKELEPELVYLPFRGDAHSDHKVVFDACASCTKWFRYPFVKEVRVYETLSETGFGLSGESQAFHPNLFVDVTSYMDRKKKALEVFGSELASFPFPRSLKAVDAQAQLRGTMAGVEAAEAFMMVRSIV